MNLITALQMNIISQSIYSSALPSAQMQQTTTHTKSKEIVNFVHKVKLHTEITPVQQKLHRLPFSIHDDVSEELLLLEKEGVIERTDSSPWVSLILAIWKKVDS